MNRKANGRTLQEQMIFEKNSEKKQSNPLFTAKIKDSQEEITGYYCPHFFNADITPTPAIHIVNDKIVQTYKIKPETLRPAEVE